MRCLSLWFAPWATWRHLRVVVGEVSCTGSSHFSQDAFRIWPLLQAMMDPCDWHFWRAPDDLTSSKLRSHPIFFSTMGSFSLADLWTSMRPIIIMMSSTEQFDLWLQYTTTLDHIFFTHLIGSDEFLWSKTVLFCYKQDDGSSPKQVQEADIQWMSSGIKLIQALEAWWK